MDNEKFAIELLREIKASAKRWFIAFCVMVGLEIVTIAGFMWYITLPVDEYSVSYEQEADNEGNNTIIGGDNYGSTTESNIQTGEESNTQ